MDNQKLENLLNLALDTPPEEREKSEELNVGFNREDRTWELIVRYSGDITHLRDSGILVYELRGGYAILTVPESLITLVSGLPQIEYVEKPKRLFFAINQAKAASCINYVQTDRFNLTGRGVLVAVIDSGIDYYHQDFRNADGTTRIVELWDQGLNRIFTREEINEALAANSRSAARSLVPSIDLSGHGTAVAAIAAGNGRESMGRNKGVAYESDLLIVKLGQTGSDGFPWTTALMKAVDYVSQRAVELSRPVAVNISFGNTYGSHDGTSLLETFIDSTAQFGRSVFVIGTGNEGRTGGHSMGNLTTGITEIVELSVAPYETGFSVQLWKSYVDRFRISLISPSGTVIGPIDSNLGPQRYTYGDTVILIYYGEPSPYSQSQEIYFDFLPQRDYIDSGIWRFQLDPEIVVVGRYDFWLPSANILNPATLFLRPSPETTLTIPSTASQVVSVGAYNDSYQSYADFSGRGYTRETNQVKPDLAAPGVDLLTARAGGGYDTVTGTSFAAPMVTGSAALMMQWGIIDQHDRFLYGEKVKAYLQRGARQLPGFDSWPNPYMGYGALCLRDSLPF